MGTSLRRTGRSPPSPLAHLRQKLEPDRSHPRYLITEAGIGYRFTAPG